MTVTKNTIIAEILNNDPTQGCVPIFLSTGMHCLGCMASHGAVSYTHLTLPTTERV